jgi:hypothetical protein
MVLFVGWRDFVKLTCCADLPISVPEIKESHQWVLREKLVGLIWMPVMIKEFLGPL